MKYSGLKQLADRSGVTLLLERSGLKGPVGRVTRFLLDRAERERSRIIYEDYRASQETFRQIACTAPAGDPRKIAWLIASMPTVWGLKLDGVMSLAVRLKNFHPVAVHLSQNKWNQRYNRLFGLNTFLNFQRFVASTPSAKSPKECVEFPGNRTRIRDLLGLTYRDVDIGRIALSNVLNRHKFAKFDLTQPETLSEVGSELLKIQRNVLAAEAMVAQHRPAIALLLEKGLSPMAEIFGVCVRDGIQVVQYVGSQRMNSYVLKRYSYDNRHQHPFSLDEWTWERVKRMPWGPVQEAELMQEFRESYQEGSWFNRKFLHEGKRIKPAEEVRRQLGLDLTKKTAVIFSHVLWDATFFYGRGLFDDYETWLLETVRAACANPRVNWVIKLHPDLVWKLKYEDYTGELRDIIAVRSAVGKLPEHVRIVPPDTDINTFSFFEITDYCVTVRGTIGIEMACYGVPVLTAGTGRYSGLGFTIDSNSSREYLEGLARIETIPPMAPGEVELARRFAHALFRLRPWPIRSFEMVKASLDQTGHPLDHNVVPHIHSFEEFAEAEDMRQLAAWIDSKESDFLEGQGQVFGRA